jgi:predicted esterase
VSVFLCVPLVFAAEPDRYDMGRRLVLLEQAWANQPDLVARRRALPVLKDALPLLLAGKGEQAAETLDRSRLLLRSAEPTPSERWAESLAVRPSARFLDPADGAFVFRLSSVYPTGQTPETVKVITKLFGDQETQLAAAVTRPLVPPFDVTFDTRSLPSRLDGDYTFRLEAMVGRAEATYSVGVSIVKNLRERLTRLNVARANTKDRGIDGQTLKSHVELLIGLARGSVPETDYPAARLLTETEELAKAIECSKPFYGPDRTGQFWLSVPTSTEPAPVRVFVPEQAKEGKPVPLVVALHGAGGSENLFFEAYGDGMIARIARSRGWMVVAPRAGGLFDAAAPVPAIIDELAKRYPIDPKRVFLVGHSMGAMQAVTLAQQSPGKYAAIAALGGGGAVTRPDAFRSLPVFVGCGREDILLGGAKGLVAALERAGGRQVTFKEYPDSEHIMIVQEALPAVFDFFDRAGQQP